MVVTRSRVISWKKLELPEGDPQEGFGADANVCSFLLHTIKVPLKWVHRENLI